MLGGLIHNSHYDGFPLIMQINHAGPLGGGWGGGHTLERRQTRSNGETLVPK